jgi:hypothetical protein
MSKIAVGPTRFRGIVLPLWVAFLVATATRRLSAALVVVVSACLLIAVRGAMTGVVFYDDSVVVVNLFRTRRLPRRRIERAGFAKRPAGWPVPLVLAGPGIWVRATGVSVYSRGFRWPDQAFVKRGRKFDQVERFLQEAGIPLDEQEPLSRGGPRG